MKKRQWKIGDLCWIRKANRDVGVTLYEITETDGARCSIREAGTRNAPQAWDTSLLVKVSSNDPVTARLNLYFFGH